MYSYTLCKEVNHAIFEDACRKLELQKSATKISHLTDVDGSEYAKYLCNGKRVEICNDYLVYAVYCDSDINLNDIFGEPIRTYCE